MDKRITKLSRNPFFIQLADQPISMYVDSDSGDLFIDEGPGKGRMNGAGLFADEGTRFLCVPAESGCVVKVACGSFIWTAGWTTDAVDAASWVDAVNRFLETKRGPAVGHGTETTSAPAVSSIG